MITKTEAIVLRFVPFSETSRMVTWFTKDQGKITTAIKGSQRPKSMFLGQYDLFYTCELLYYTRENDQVHAMRECSPLQTRASLRTNWKGCAAASYIADLFRCVSPPSAHQKGLYELLAHGLDHAPLVTTNPTYLFWFELNVLRQLGIAPRLTEQRPTQQNRGEAALLDLDDGAVRLGQEDHSPSHRSVRIPPDILAILMAWQKTRSPQVAMATKCSASQLDHIESVLGKFLTFHLEFGLESRRIALDTIRRHIG